MQDGVCVVFFFSSRRRHTRCSRDWSSDVCSSDPLSAQPMSQRTTSSRWKRAGLAGVLSLFIPGTGQLYNRQPRKALLLVLPIPVLVVFAAKTRIVFSFVTMVAFFALLEIGRASCRERV